MSSQCYCRVTVAVPRLSTNCRDSRSSINKCVYNKLNRYYTSRSQGLRSESTSMSKPYSSKQLDVFGMPEPVHWLANVRLTRTDIFCHSSQSLTPAWRMCCRSCWSVHLHPAQIKRSQYKTRTKIGTLIL